MTREGTDPATEFARHIVVQWHIPRGIARDLAATLLSHLSESKEHMARVSWKCLGQFYSEVFKTGIDLWAGERWTEGDMHSHSGTGLR